jgi:uncharacterized protein YcaQ
MLMSGPLIISHTQARQIAITAQYLADPRPNNDADGIMEVINRLGCLQLDPINVVARSHLLVLWSRLGNYDPLLLDTLLWQERRLFEYWAHAASIVLTEDYPIHQMEMLHYARDSSNWSQKRRDWMEQNDSLRVSILHALHENGPLRSRDFEDTSVAAWQSTGWTQGRNVSRMLDFLWIQGQILVARRVAGEKWWDLAERCLPTWISYDPLPEHEVVSRAAKKSLRALGVATERNIVEHFTQGRYPGLSGVLAELEAVGQIIQVRIHTREGELPGKWFTRADLLPILEQPEIIREPRTTLLSPFDNLICNRKRTQLLFNFSYQSEIYTPKDKRRFGYYVMPILYGDRLVGRIDPALNRAQRTLVINAVHIEPDVPITSEMGQAVIHAIQELAHFLNATTINYSHQMPQDLKHLLDGPSAKL